jgi:hypothetical protein
MVRHTGADDMRHWADRAADRAQGLCGECHCAGFTDVFHLSRGRPLCGGGYAAPGPAGEFPKPCTVAHAVAGGLMGCAA